jgi:hypothetical protein
MIEDSLGSKAQCVRRGLLHHRLRGRGFSGLKSHSTNFSTFSGGGWSACTFPHPSAAKKIVEWLEHKKFMKILFPVAYIKR